LRIVDKHRSEYKTFYPHTFGIVGLGLMGGAFAKALMSEKIATQKQIYACDKNEEVLEAAHQEKLICKSFNSSNAGEMLVLCDVIFLCLNPSSAIKFIDQWKDSFKNGCVVTDIAGTKASVAAAAKKLCEYRNDIDFIPGHPMAGAEKSGFNNSCLCNFHKKNYILTPISCNKQENIDFLKRIIYRIGFSRITEVTPEEHDRKIAFTSQLCHLIAASLIDCESDTNITRFGGGSFEDLTRIAMLNAPMWTELFSENKAALLDRVNQFEKSLDEIKALIKNGQTEELEKRLEIVRERRIEMSR